MAKSLSGNIHPNPDMVGSISETKNLFANIQNKPLSIQGAVSGAVTSYPPKYNGVYEIKPDMHDFVLDTKDKMLIADIIVKQIPVYTIANSSGGNTVTIGGDFNYG